MGTPAPEPVSFDWSTATIGASVGVVAALAALKLLRRGSKDDEFARA